MAGFRPTGTAPDVVMKSLSDARTGLLDITARQMVTFDEECERAVIADQLGRWT